MKDKSIYLIAKYSGRPKDPRQTSRPGYITNPDNIIYDEQLYLSRGLRDRDMQHQIVLNLTEQTVVKNSFRTNATFEEIFTHFYEGYAEYIDECVNKLNENIT